MLEFHPLADRFPLIQGVEFDELVGDIRENGLHDKIMLLDGRILDGRNRYRAARAAGTFDDPSPIDKRFFETYDRAKFGDPVTWVISKNLHRRHLDDSQRALIAAEFATLRRGRPSEWNKPGNRDDKTGQLADYSDDGLTQSQAADRFSVSERQVRRGRQVLDHAAPEVVEAVRNAEVPISSAAELSRLPVGEQLAILRGADPKAFARVAKERRAETQGNKRELRDTREAELAARQAALPDKRYGVIYADPEWRFEPYSRDSGLDRAADNHYPTSAVDDIAARPVASIAADDCALFLWATVPMLPEALQVMKAWGFAYKSHTVWRKAEAIPQSSRSGKVVLGTGYWFRNAHEVLLVGTRGNVPAPAMGTQWPSVVDAPPRKHSQKPDWAYELIEDYFPTLGKIELNARARRDGWDAWGLEAPERNTQRGESGTAREASGSTAPESQKANGIAGLSVTGVDGGALPTIPVRQDGAQPAPPTDFDIVRAAEGLPPDEADEVAAWPEGSVPAQAGDGGGEGGPSEKQAPDALPGPLSRQQQNEIITREYARSPFPGLAAIAEMTGLTPNAVQQRAKRMKLGDPERQREAVVAFNRRRSLETEGADA